MTLVRAMVWCCIVAAAAAGFAAPARKAAPGERILATEDSLQVYVAPETTRVVARRMPLAEIIRKAQEGESHKYDGITTLAYNRTVKVTLHYGGRKPKLRCIESIARVYFQSPDHWAEAPLRESKYVIDDKGEKRPWSDKDEDEGNVEIDFNEGESARKLSDLPPYLEDTDKYNFQIVHRSLQRDQVLYEIAFAPKSEFDILPGGHVWLLTGSYQIVREEYELKNLPVPWILKSLGLLTREWQTVDGRWVPRRITARAGLRTAVGLGLVEIPDTAEVAVQFDDYRFDPPLDPALFERKRP